MSKLYWDECKDPWRMLPLLREYATDRKLRLFAIECCRPLKVLFKDKRCLFALEVCEQFAEGLASIDALENAYASALSVYEEMDDSEGVESAALAIANACWIKQDEREKSLMEVMSNSIGVSRCFIPWKNAKHIQKRRVCSIIRDIFGHPFHTALFEVRLLAWNNGVIPKIARNIYDSRDFKLLPILADALEEGGYIDDFILHHARNSNQHFRGCWLIDSILEQDGEKGGGTRYDIGMTPATPCILDASREARQ
jgi:hypothetical protein